MNKQTELVCHKSPQPHLGDGHHAGSDEEGGDKEDSAGYRQEEA